MSELVVREVQGFKFETFEYNDKNYVTLKSLCAGMGLVYNGQWKRCKARGWLTEVPGASISVTGIVLETGGTFVLALCEDRVAVWAYTIQVSRVINPVAQAKIKQFQEHVDKIIETLFPAQISEGNVRLTVVPQIDNLVLSSPSISVDVIKHYPNCEIEAIVRLGQGILRARRTVDALTEQLVNKLNPQNVVISEDLI